MGTCHAMATLQYIGHSVTLFPVNIKVRYKLKWDPRFRCHMIILNSARPGGIVSLKMSEMLPYSAGDYRREVLGKVLELGYNG